VKNVGVDDCSIYQSYRKCEECSVGFIKPTNDSSECILSSTIQNCQEYIYNSEAENDKVVCKKCKDGYILLNKQCEDGSTYISNCL
jgi:hypothetical protein